MGATPLQLRAGPASAIFHDGDIRYLTVAGREVVRRVYVTVRDTTWGTLRPTLHNVMHANDSRGFVIEYDARYQQDTIDLNCHVRITADVSEQAVRIAFALTAQAHRDFETNRVGLCVLHPIRDVRGVPCQITQGDGTKIDSRFPDDVAPHAPFTNISVMQYDVAGVGVRVEFDGELFEAEDQRNWSDTSYKTYCRPLTLPRPYAIRAGDDIRQTVTFEITPQSNLKMPQIEPLRIGRALGPMPRFGTVINGPLSEAAVEAVRRLSLAFIRHDARPSIAGWRDRLNAVAALGWPIDLALHVDDERQLPAASELPANVRRITVFSNRKPVTDPALGDAARHTFPHRSIAGGTIGNFTELNRNRPSAGTFDALTYGVCPQIHAMDDLSIMENLTAQGDAVRTARTFAAGLPIAVGPVTIRRQPDPFAAGNDGKPVEAAIDPRHATQFAAAWTIGSIKHLIEAGAATVLYYEAAGSHGLVAADGSPHPLYQVFAELADFADGEVCEVNDPQPLHYKAFAVRKGDRTKLFIANVGWEPVTVPIEGREAVSLPVHGTRVMEWENR